MTESTTTPADEMVERVARAMHATDPWVAWESMTTVEQEPWRDYARAAIAALAPELNQADLTVRSVALKVREAREAQRDLTPDEVVESIETYKVVMK